MIELLMSGGIMFQRSEYTRILNPGSGVIDPPYGAVAMRAAAIGAGGGAAIRKTASIARAMGGAGGGCAATIIIPATAISYTIGAGGPGIRYSSDSGTDPAGTGGDTIATFFGYELIGKGGPGGYVNNSSDYSLPGGVGIGGDYSFQGGAAYRAFSGNTCASTGGGGAGPNGDGADGQRNNLTFTLETANQGAFANIGWGDGGGASGVVRHRNEDGGRRGGGAGMGQFVGDEAALSTSVFGRSDGSLGGGGSGASSALSISPWHNGGPGGLIVEWFF